MHITFIYRRRKELAMKILRMLNTFLKHQAEIHTVASRLNRY